MKKDEDEIAKKLKEDVIYKIEQIEKSPEFQKKVEEEVRQKLLDETSKLVESEVNSTIPKQSTKIKLPKLQLKNQSVFTEFRNFFGDCWRGNCRYITIIAIIIYMIIGIVLLSCTFFNLGFCSPSNILGAAPFLTLIALLGLGLMAILAFLTPKSQFALIFSAILAVPIIIVLFISISALMATFLTGALLLYLIFSSFHTYEE